ncbi:HAD family hydrolase [Streptomyces sp. NPDC056486]|uniref:HAD family hydrolase n=1 Tax=Streptomyces sp. NPDC056486 TaxID=3345835 RepID=UPI0036AC5A7B
MIVISQSQFHPQEAAAATAGSPDSPTAPSPTSVDSATLCRPVTRARDSALPPQLDGIRGLILDWDGTLADTHQARYRALTQALSPYHVALPETWYRQHAGLPILDLIALLPKPVPTARVRAASSQLLLHHLQSGRLRPIPVTLALLQQAHAAGLPCAIASSTSLSLVTAGLSALGLLDAFQAVVTVEDVAQGKPAPDVFLEAARRIGVPALRCLAVDDAPDGIAAARAARMNVFTLSTDQTALVRPSKEVITP